MATEDCHCTVGLTGKRCWRKATGDDGLCAYCRAVCFASLVGKADYHG